MMKSKQDLRQAKNELLQTKRNAMKKGDIQTAHAAELQTRALDYVLDDVGGELL